MKRTFVLLLLMAATGLVKAQNAGVDSVFTTEQDHQDMLQQLAWRQHDGGHTDAPNFQSFITWADKQLNHQSIKTP